VRNILTFAVHLFGAYYSLVKEFYAHSENNQKILEPVDKKTFESYLNQCRERIEESMFDQAWEAGQDLTMDNAIRKIMSDYQLGGMRKGVLFET